MAGHQTGLSASAPGGSAVAVVHPLAILQTHRSALFKNLFKNFSGNWEGLQNRTKESWQSTSEIDLDELYKTNGVGRRLLIQDYGKDKEEVNLSNTSAVCPLKLVNQWTWGSSPQQGGLQPALWHLTHWLQQLKPKPFWWCQLCNYVFISRCPYLNGSQGPGARNTPKLLSPSPVQLERLNQFLSDQNQSVVIHGSIIRIHQDECCDGVGRWDRWLWQDFSNISATGSWETAWLSWYHSLAAGSVSAALIQKPLPFTVAELKTSFFFCVLGSKL